MDIIAVGEVLIDLTQTGIRENRIRQYAANPGGAPANVAVAAARLGAETGFVGKVGRDIFGQDLRAVLDENSVDTSGLYETDQVPTTQAVVSLDARGERDFFFYRSPGADTLLTTEEVLLALKRIPKFLHIGSVSLTAEPSRSATLAAARYGRKLGALVSYDPNYRSSLWPDEQTAVARMKEPLAMSDVVKLSDEELPLITGTDDLEEGSRRLLDNGVALVLVTLGSEGTFYRLGDNTGRVPGVSVSVADTNGAGDTFLGALLSRLAKRPNGPLCCLTAEELESYLRFANRAAAITCSRSGAIPAMPTLAELED